MRDPAKFGEILAAFAAAEAALAEAEENWLNLEILREETEELTNVATGQSPNQPAVSRICSLNDSGDAQNLDNSP